MDERNGSYKILCLNEQETASRAFVNEQIDYFPFKREYIIEVWCFYPAWEKNDYRQQRLNH